MSEESSEPDDGTYATSEGFPDGDPTSVPSGLGQIGPYRLIREIGRGAMGAVYEAEHERLKRRMAVKVLPEHLASSSERYGRFQREMEAIGQLEHENIVLATDAGQYDGVCFIAMQLVDGVDLAKLLAHQGALSVGAACQAVHQVALGLGEIDRHQMIHRDIKPSNLLLTKEGVVKILDLGIAAIRRDTSASDADSRPDSLTMSGCFLGTPDYVAPEQITNQGPIDIRADIYSLGCTLYHLLSGRTPFAGEEYKSLPEKLLGHAEHTAAPLGVDSAVPAELSRIIERMMAKDRAERFSNPLEVADLLLPFCDPAALESIAGATSKFPRRSVQSRGGKNESIFWWNRKTLWLGAATLLAAATVGIFFLETTELLNDSPAHDMVRPSSGEKFTVAQSNQKLLPAVDRLQESSEAIETATRSMSERLESIDRSTATMVKSNEKVADNTAAIAISLDEMRQQFDSAIQKITEQPQTPTEWYANALIHARSGNQLEARRAYLKFFQNPLNVIDPFQSFAQLLKLQEGVAGARQSFAAIPGPKDLEARRLAEIGLEPQEKRRVQLITLLKESPEFGPAYYVLAQEIARTDITWQSLIDQLAHKQALQKYLDVHDQGNVLKYYFDQSNLEEIIVEARRQLKFIENVDENLLNHPVRITEVMPFDPSKSDDPHWLLLLEFAEGARDGEYRLSPEQRFMKLNMSEFQPPPANYRTKPPEAVDLTLSQTGSISIPKDTRMLDIEIKYMDRNAVPRGPFLLRFDGEKEEIDLALSLFYKKDPEELVDLSQDRYIRFTGLLIATYKAIKEVRYGVNVEQPDRILKLPTEDYGPTTRDQYRVSVDEPIRFVTLQVTTKDDKTTEVFRYTHSE